MRPESSTSCKPAMMAAATVHPRRQDRALGSIETSGSNTSMPKGCRAGGATARDQFVALYQLFQGRWVERYGFAVPPRISSRLLATPKADQTASLPKRGEHGSAT